MEGAGRTTRLPFLTREATGLPVRQINSLRQLLLLTQKQYFIFSSTLALLSFQPILPLQIEKSRVNDHCEGSWSFTFLQDFELPTSASPHQQPPWCLLACINEDTMQPHKQMLNSTPAAPRRRRKRPTQLTVSGRATLRRSSSTRSRIF
jgi:hypothetical protein